MRRSAFRLLLAAGVVSGLSGCAIGQDPRDPLENFNRAMFTVNDTFDRYALKPAAEVYSETVPSFMQTGVYNFFGNLGDIWTAVNNLLQGKVGNGVSDIMRVAINTGFGFGGVLDIASEAGLDKHKQDFGSTLGYWGVGAGPYVVLPFFGSSTLRDTLALPADIAADPWGNVDPVRVRNSGRVIRVVDLRAGVLDAVNLIEEAALDRYEFIRDGYLQRRAAKVNEGRGEQSERRDDKPATTTSSVESSEPGQNGNVESGAPMPAANASGQGEMEPVVKEVSVAAALPS